jgi:hypothetical protein
LNCVAVAKAARDPAKLPAGNASDAAPRMGNAQRNTPGARGRALLRFVTPDELEAFATTVGRRIVTRTFDLRRLQGFEHDRKLGKRAMVRIPARDVEAVSRLHTAMNHFLTDRSGIGVVQSRIDERKAAAGEV